MGYRAGNAVRRAVNAMETAIAVSPIMRKGRAIPSKVLTSTAPRTPAAKMATLNATPSMELAMSAFSPLAALMAVCSCGAAPPKATPRENNGDEHRSGRVASGNENYTCGEEKEEAA